MGAPSEPFPSRRLALRGAVEFKARRRSDLHEPRVSEPLERAVVDRPAMPHIEPLLNEKLSREQRLKHALTTAALIDVTKQIPEGFH